MWSQFPANLPFSAENGVRLLLQHHHNIAWFRAWGLVGLPSEGDPRVVLGAALDEDLELLLILDRLPARAGLAPSRLGHHLPLALAGWARLLHLLHHARPDLANNNPHSLPSAVPASRDARATLACAVCANDVPGGNVGEVKKKAKRGV